MKRLLISIFFTIGFSIWGSAQEPDSVVSTRSNPFIRDLLAKNEHVYPMFVGDETFLKFKYSLFNERNQFLIKTPGNLYVLLAGSGFLFVLENPKDSVLRFKRVDRTVNLNYNQGAYVFHEGEKLYNFGGYGFWKNNGILRRYNPQSEEWDVEPLSEELYPQLSPIAPTWVDLQTQKLYLPYQSNVHSGLKDRSYIKGKITDRASVLDLKTLDWVHLGKTNKKLIELLTTATYKINSTRGLILLWNDELYLVNYPKNEMRKLKDYAKAQSVLKLTNNYTLTYHYNKTIYSYNLANQKYDSIALDLDQFEPLGQRIYKSSFNLLQLIALLMVSFAGFWAFRSYKKAKSRRPPNRSEEEHAYQVSFSDVEKSLLKMLAEKAKNKQTAVITDINYILGVKDKNTGLQKKVRSDTFNSINEKYRYLTKQNDPLIQSVRSELDKRYFEYFIAQEQAKEIEQFI